MLEKERNKQQIEAVIEQYRHGFATTDAEELKAIWDQEYAQIIFVAQELAQPIWSWTEVEHYYQRIARLFERVKTMEISDLSLNILGDAAFAFLSFHFEGQVKGQIHIADGRASFLLHRTNETWKVIHYHESRPGDFPIKE